MSISTVLLDAGSVILDESLQKTVCAETVVTLMQEIAPGYTLSDYEADVEAAVAAFSPDTLRGVLWRRTRPDVDQFARLNAAFHDVWQQRRPPLRLTDGIDAEMRAIARAFKLAVAGQYGRDMLTLLGEHGLLDCLCSRITQDDFSITKPDPRYFEQIARALGVRTEECIMVGDRIDNDIVPAKQVGMKTIRIRVGSHIHQEPRTPNEIPDMELPSVVGLAAAVRQLARS